MEMLLRLPAPDIWSRDRARLPMTLSEINPELLQAAVLKHISTSKWFPTVAEIRAPVAEIVLQTANQPTALEAWGFVMQGSDS